jgi:hypothetical protein
MRSGEPAKFGSGRCSRPLSRGWGSPWLTERSFKWTSTCFFELHLATQTTLEADAR